MNLFEYQEAAKGTAIYPRDKAMIYPALGLIGECGEVAEKVKKIIRDDCGTITDKRREAIMKELGDCCWYLASVCGDTNLSLGMIYENRDSCIDRYIRRLDLPRLVLLLNKLASKIADTLRVWYYNHGRRQDQSFRFINEMMPRIASMLMCVETIAQKCGFTLEEVYTANINKLLDRKDRGVLKGDGDQR